MNYYLFSTVNRCKPCRLLVDLLDEKIPNWKKYIKYVDVDNCSKEDEQLSRKLGVLRIPAFGTDTTLLKASSYLDIFKEIKSICIGV